MGALSLSIKLALASAFFRDERKGPRNDGPMDDPKKAYIDSQERSAKTIQKGHRETEGAGGQSGVFARSVEEKLAVEEEEMSEAYVEYFTAEHEHAVAMARAKVQDWDLSMPLLLLEHLEFLHEYVEEVAAKAARA